MNSFLRKFSVCFVLVLSLFSVTNCTGLNSIASTSNGIVTYNRATRQFEMMWDNSLYSHSRRIDTIYICPTDTSEWKRVK